MIANSVLAALRLPVIGAPLFIISNPKLVIAQCTSGIVGSFPALNARPASQLDEWLHEISEALADHDRKHPDRPSAPFAVTTTEPFSLRVSAAMSHEPRTAVIASSKLLVS